MTGFARRERQFPWGLLAWELKTVNHRFLEMGCRLPEEFRVGEAEFRQAVAAAVRRGKVECSLHFRPAVVAGALEVDAELLASLTQRAQQIAAQAGAAARIDVLDLLRWPGVIRDGTRDHAPMIAAAHALLADALAELARFRDSEGGTPARRAGAALRRTDRIRRTRHGPAAGGAGAHAREIARAHRTAGAATSITTGSSRNSRSWRSGWTSTRRSTACAATWPKCARPSAARSPPAGAWIS